MTVACSLTVHMNPFITRARLFSKYSKVFWKNLNSGEEECSGSKQIFEISREILGKNMVWTEWVWLPSDRSPKGASTVHVHYLPVYLIIMP